MRRRRTWLALAIAVTAALVVTGVAVTRRSPIAAAAASPRVLDPARWVRTSDGDFEEAVVDESGGRLRFRAATRGTRDDTVKYLGVRSAKDFPLEPGARLRARLDWNRQENGSYLSGAVILSPRATTGNPLLEADWVKVEWVGVPPGQNARLQIVSRSSGRERLLYNEGWPETHRTGRPVTTEDLELRMDAQGLTVLDQGSPVALVPKDKLAGFDSAYLYLQLSSHSNYPPRELFFDEIVLPSTP